MNRLATFAKESSVSPSFPELQDALASVPRMGSGSSARCEPCPAPHATFTPLCYEAGYAYPLLVWLHGAGENEEQLRQVMPHVSMRNFVAVAPRGSLANVRDACKDLPGCPTGPLGPATGFDWRQNSAGIEEAQARVFDCITMARERFHIHDLRVFLVGSGSGGTMALRIAWDHPQQFAGVATLGGPLPTQHAPLWRVNDLRRLPCLLVASRESRLYPEKCVCRDLRLLHTAGCTVALRLYPGGDEVTTAKLSDLNRWMMELVCTAVT